MDYQKALENLEAFKVAMDKYLANLNSQDEYNDLCLKYGEVEEIIHRFAGDSKVQVPKSHGASSIIYPNFIEAGFLSGRTIHQHEGYTQLLKIIGKARQAASDPNFPPPPPTITSLVQILRRFRECCQYIQTPPRNERDVQDILWIMLRSQYDRVDRENILPRFGAKAYRPDFGLPDLQTLIEVKFIGDKGEAAVIQEEILADVPGYLNANTRFSGIVELVYDHAQKLRDPRKFIEDLQKVDGILEVIVVPGISA
jgi:hypothetical protein